LLLSLLPPSCIVAPIRELVNTLFLISTKAFSTSSMTHDPSYIDIDIDIDTSRGRSTSSNNKSSREFSMHSNTSSVPYFKRMEIQSDNPLWSK